jgi:hypothetical protein
MNRRHFLSTSVAAGVATSSSEARNGPKDLRRAGFMGIAKAKKDLPRTATLKVTGDYATAQVTLTEAQNSLYRGGHDGGNYRISINGEDDRQLMELLCLNTTTQGVQAAQERWLTMQKPATSPVLCFLHIPLLQYDTVWQKKLAKGIFKEPVCTYGEDGSAIAKLKKFGDVKACFCGHDHVNDFSGTWQGIEMVYGRATGHAGYGANKLKKGGKLITTNLNDPKKSYTWKTVFADGSDWSPEKG